MDGQARRRTIATAAAFVVAQLAWLCPLAASVARAAESSGPATSVSASTASPSTCPAADAVWAIVLDMVPRAATEVLAAKRRVLLLDLDDQYRVQVATDHGLVERTNTDPARDCDQRARFVAEFIVLTLLPPQLGPGDAPPAAAPPPAPPPPPPPPPSPRAPAEPPPIARVVRVELGVDFQASPGLQRAPRVSSFGPDVRVRVGSAWLAGIVGAAYFPDTPFALGGVRGSLQRVPFVVGGRARVLTGRFELAADLAVSVALERYAGVSPKVASEATRVAPGIEAGGLASAPLSRGLALFAALRGAFFFATKDLGALPQGVVGSTPSLWVGGTLGLAFEL